MANTERVKTMRAAVRDSLGNVVMQSAVAVPTPAKGQVLIRVRAAAYNQIDHKYGPFGGRVPGQDVAGVVEACGPEVLCFTEGDEVFGFAAKGDGSLAEFALADAGKITRKPAKMTFEEAAAMPVSYLTGYQALLTAGGFKKGNAVLVIGASGGCGMAGVELATRLGASEVVGVCSKENIPLVIKQGASRCVDYTDKDAYAQLVKESKFDLIYDCASGFGKAECYHADAAKMLTETGKVVTLNGPALTWIRFFTSTQARLVKLVLAKQSGADLAGLVAKLPNLHPAIGEVLELTTDGVARGFAILKSRRAKGKVVLSLTDSGARPPAAGELPDWTGRVLAQAGMNELRGTVEKQTAGTSQLYPAE